MCGLAIEVRPEMIPSLPLCCREESWLRHRGGALASSALKQQHPGQDDNFIKAGIFPGKAADDSQRPFCDVHLGNDTGKTWVEAAN
jgi:hypothetical protein